MDTTVLGLSLWVWIIVAIVVVALGATIFENRRKTPTVKTVELPARDPNVNGSCKVIPCGSTAEWNCSDCRRPICRVNHAKVDEDGHVVCKGVSHITRSVA